MKFYRLRIAIIEIILMFVVGISAPTYASAGLNVSDLTVDNLDNPTGIENISPRFSWKLKTETPSTLQTTYEIHVSKIKADGTGVIIWESGKVTSEQSLYIAYSGPELESRTRYKWEARIWDNHGNVSEWSSPAYWEMGLLQPSDWKGTWITYPWSEDVDKPQPSPMFRRQFNVDCKLQRARLYITALGLYEAVINGKRVGDAYFTPGWTSYDERLQYQVYDITDALRHGENAIGILLGDGWYRGHMTAAMLRNFYGDRLATRAQIHIDCSDNRERIVVTDETWHAGTGSIQVSDIYNGESQDLRRRPEGWSLPSMAVESWKSAAPFHGSTPALVPSTAPPVRATQIIKPVQIMDGPDGETIVDMGQNMVGWVRLRAKGRRGDEIVLHHAEVVDTDGSLYLTPLRKAKQRVAYILADDKTQILEPHFTFQGFRYIRIDGYPGELSLDDIEGVVLHSDLPATGYFKTSSDMLNRLQSNIAWSQRGNFLEVPMDCPQRDERLGWTGDAQVFAKTATYNMNTAAFFDKWLADVRIDQLDNGAVPVVVPDVLSQFKIGPKSGWGDVITELPHIIYNRYGDRKTLADSYRSMRKWVEYEKRRAANWWQTWSDTKNWFSSERRRDAKYIWDGDKTFGDWLSPNPPGATFVNTVYFARSAKLLSEASRILGKEGDEAEYDRLYQNIRKAFQRQYFSADGLLTEDVQGAYVLALQFNLLDPDQAVKAAQHLDELVRNNDYRLSTGFLSTPHFLSVLAHYGYLDSAYQVLMQTEHPSWLYPITKGATTMWERWGSIRPDGSFGNAGMNSFNHYAYGAVGDWMYRNIGGIAPAAPGYKKIRIAPLPGGELQFATARLDSPYGTIASAWRTEKDRFEIAVEIPPNTTAELIIPEPYKNLQRSGIPVAVENGVHGVSNEDGKAVVTLGSGYFKFSGKRSAF